MNDPIILDSFSQTFNGGYGGGYGAQTYDAVQWNNDREWKQIIVDDSHKTYPSYTRRQMMSLGRNARANVGFIKGAISDVGLYSVGVGIGMKSGIADTAIRKQFDEAWETYVSTPAVDVYGRFSLATLLRLHVEAIFTDCDSGAVFVEDPLTGRAQIQSIRAHRIDDCGKNDSIDGAILDKVGRTVKWRIGSREKFVEVDDAQFHLFFDPECVDNVRGIHPLAHAFNKLQDIKEILEAETHAVKDNSKISFAVKVTNGGKSNNFFGKQTEVKDSDGKVLYKTEAMRRGFVPRLLPGEDLWTHESSRPSPTFTGFLEYHDQDVATGFGLPLAFIRASDVGGPSQRFVMTKAQRKFDWIQHQILIPFLRRFRFIWAAQEIERGALPDVPDWWKVTPQLPSKATIDVGREAQQNREDLRFGNRSLEEDAAERGTTGDAIQSQRKHAAVNAFSLAIDAQAEILATKKVEIPLETIMQHIAMVTPNGNSPVQNAPDEPKKEEKKP